MEKKTAPNGFFNKHGLNIALVATLISVGLFVYMTNHHYGLKLGLTQGKSICNVSATLDCDTVNTSKFSVLFGFPIALWGLVANAILALVLLSTRFSEDFRKNFLRYAFYGTGLTALVSMVMAILSVTQLGYVCLFCSFGYILSFVGFFAMFMATPSPKFEAGDIPALLRSGPGGFRWLGVSILLMPLIVGAINAATLKSLAPGLQIAIAEALAEWEVNQVFAFNIDGALVKGREDSPVMDIVEFADFNCPHCKAAAPQIATFQKTHPDVRVRFMNFPLDGACNEAIKNPGHRSSCAIAKSVVCAGQQGKGWEALDWAFENQGSVTDATLAALPNLLSISKETLDACVQSSETHATVMKQAKAAADAGLEGTPTVYVNGRKLPRGAMMAVLQALYEKLTH